MPEEKYISLDNLVRFKEKLDVELHKKQNNIGFNAAVPQEVTPIILTTIQNGNVYYKILDLKDIPGYDATKMQTLKNFNGTICWVDD